MLAWLEQQSESLGQWHYILGYLIGLTSHNWPIMLSLALCFWQGLRLYRQPTRAQVCLFYGWLLLACAYEYRKHLAIVLHEAIDFLLIQELSSFNRFGHLVVGTLIPVLLVSAALGFAGHGLRLRSIAATQQKQLERTATEA